MTAYIRVDQSGYITGHTEVPEYDAIFPEDEIWVEIGEMPIDLMSSEFKHRYDHDMGSITLTDKPKFPVAPYTFWDEVLGEWTDPRELQEKKDDKWSEIKLSLIHISEPTRPY